jgi:steroid delta-isomerase-like uncharacterized protein
MQTERNVAVIRRLYDEFFNRGRVELAEALHGPGFAYHDITHPEDVVGLSAYLERNAGFAAAFPDRHVQIEDVIAAGDRVVARATMRATHAGALAGIPATGRQVRLASTIIYRVAGGRIVEEWEIFDVLGMFQQLGVTPPGEISKGTSA